MSYKFHPKKHHLFFSLEKSTVTHSSVLAWRIPWTEEAGGPSYLGLQSRTRLKQLSMNAPLLLDVKLLPRLFLGHGRDWWRYSGGRSRPSLSALRCSPSGMPEASGVSEPGAGPQQPALQT